jgi:RNA polymerase sigma factor (sigma-70 family)
VWERHAAELRRRCRRWTSTPDLAEEAFSRTAVVAFQKYALCRDEIVDARKWLIAVTHNVCIDLYRESKRSRLEALEITETVRDPSIDPEWAVITKNLEDRVRDALRTMPATLRRPLELSLYEECSAQEIGDRLGVSALAIRKRLQHGREQLRRRLREPPPAPSAIPDRFVHAEIATDAGGVERDVLLFLGYPPMRVSAARIAELERLLEAHPGGWRLKLRLARALRAAGRTTEAMELLNDIHECRPREAAVAVELNLLRGLCEPADIATRAVQHLAQGHSLQALALIATEPSAANDSVLLALAADALSEVGPQRRALRCAERALELDAGNFIALRHVIRARIDAGEVRGAAGRSTLRLLRKLRQVAPLRADVAGLNAAFHIARGETTEALRLIEQLIGSRPQYVQAWLAAAATYFLAGRVDCSGRAARRALALDPDSSRTVIEACRILGCAGFLN